MTRLENGVNGSASVLGSRPSALIIQTSYLGDVVLTTPLIRQLSQGDLVDVVVTPSAAPLLANNPHIERLHVYDKRRSHRGILGLSRVARAIRKPSTATAYCAQGSHRTALLALLAGCKERVGFDTSAGQWLYTQRVRHRAEQHHAERLLRLALGDDALVTPAMTRPELFPGDAERRDVDAVLATVPLGEEPLIALAPGSVWATKRWPYFPELARRLGELGRVVVIGSADDQPIARAIVEATRGMALDATGRLSLLASAELLSRCALLITNDSAPQHLASAMDTPTITIFGPTVPQFGFGPLATGSRIAGHDDLACRPCHPHGPQVCPLGHWRCMRELPAARIAELAMGVLAAPAA